MKIKSERGKDCTIVNPWPGKKVRVFRDGKPTELVEGYRFTLKTAARERMELRPEE